MNIKPFIKTNNIITIEPDTLLSQAVSKLSTSHDAAVVVNGKKYLGMITPYQSLIKHSNFTRSSIAKHVMFHPPKLLQDDSAQKAVDLMLQSHVHYLPVVSGTNEFVGLLSARTILQQFLDQGTFATPISEILEKKSKPLVSVYPHQKVTEIFHLFEENNVSKLVVITEDLKLFGIVTYYDLIPHLIAPTDREDKQSIHYRLEEFDSLADLKVENVAKTYLHTANPDVTADHCLKEIIQKNIGSVILTNQENYPVGIVTIREFLDVLKSESEEPHIQLSTSNMSESSLEILENYFPKLERWIEKQRDLVKTHIFVKEEKNGGLFKVTVQMFPKKGKSHVYTHEDKNLVDVLSNINKNH